MPRAQGEPLLEPGSKRAAAVAAEYAHCTADTWSSKGMLEVIRRKMSGAAALSQPDRPSCVRLPWVRPETLPH